MLNVSRQPELPTNICSHTNLKHQRSDEVFQFRNHSRTKCYKPSVSLSFGRTCIQRKKEPNPLQSRKSRACHAKGPEPKGRQRDARDVHRAPCRAESHAPATQKARGAQGTPEGRQRRTSRPLQSRKSHACHAKGPEPKGRQRDARDVHRAPCRAESRAPATQKAWSPRDARGTPETYIAPLAEQKVARLPRKRPGAQGTPEGRQRCTSRPLQGRKPRACHAKGAEPKGRQRDARGVHRAPCRAESHAPATQKARSPRDARGTPETYITPLPNPKSRACHAKGPPQSPRDARWTPEAYIPPLAEQKVTRLPRKKPAEPKGRQRDARGTPETYITPLAEQKVARLPRKRPGAQGTPEGRQRRTSRPLQSRKSRACHAKARSPRDARGTPETYITPLAEQKVTRLPRKRRRSPRDARGTPETYITPLAEQKVTRLPRKRPGAQGTPEGRQRRTSRPLQSRKSRACHAKGPEPKGRQRHARDVHRAPCRAESRTPATQKARSPRDARGRPEAYIPPLARQKVTRLPRKRPGAQGTPEGRQEGRQRRTSRPLQSRKSRACHAKGAEPKGRQRDARDVHHAPCRAESRAPATQKDMCE